MKSSEKSHTERRINCEQIQNRNYKVQPYHIRIVGNHVREKFEHLLSTGRNWPNQWKLHDIKSLPPEVSVFNF